MATNPSNSNKKGKNIIHLDTEFQQGHHHQEHVPELEAQVEGCDSSNPEGGDYFNQTNISSGRGHTSWVWPYFDKVVTNEQDEFYAKCKICKDFNRLRKSDGTEIMARHLKNQHRLGPKGEETSAGDQTQLHRIRMIEEFSKFVINDELPFNFGESSNYEYFNRVALQPAFKKVSRNALKRHIQRTYFTYRSYLIEMFRTFDGRVSLTSDMWISPFEELFVCVTVCWIDNDWLLQKRIICFEGMEENHNGFNVKSCIINCLKNFHLLDKVFSLSFDNATANMMVIDFLKQDADLSLLLDDALLHVRCCAHILNLSVQEGIAELQPLLEPIRKVVRWIRITSSVKRAYKKRCEERGLRKKVWSLDNPTCWNSTYKLLNDAIKYRDVLTELYNENHSDPNELITNDHWILATVIRDVLATFDNATNVFSYVYEPNIHQVILECIKIVNSISEASYKSSISNILDRMKAKWCSYVSEFPHIYGIAAILDPGIKIDGLKSLLTFYYQRLGIEYNIDSYVIQCKTLLEKLYNHYASIYQQQSAGVSKPKGRWDPLLASILKKQRTSSSSAFISSSGVDNYLSYQFETNDDFHIIKWWKDHTNKFPILARIAKDVLAIPASTIVSESAFSAGRRILDEKICRFAPQSIEMC
ncbi:putative AC transposase, partial [Bienertia sinuspersici]